MAFTLVLVHFVVLASAMAVVNIQDSYSFSYAVNAEATGDYKSHREQRSGGIVKGSYSVLEPGGILRVVEYTADPVMGFRAVVHRRALPPVNITTESPPTTGKPGSVTQRLLSKVEELPSTMERSLPAQRFLTTTERLLSSTERLTSKTSRLPSTEASAMTTHTPDNLGHFAAAMFSTRRRKFHRRRRQ